MKHFAVAATVVALFTSACASQKGSTASRAPLRDGRYTFSERPPQTSMAIEGTMTVIADTVIADLHSGICRYENRFASREAPFVYNCGDVTLSFDRFDPLRKATYRTSRTVYDRKQVCEEYTTNSSGQRVCLRYRTETTERQVPVNGSLHPVRVIEPTG